MTLNSRTTRTGCLSPRVSEMRTFKRLLLASSGTDKTASDFTRTAFFLEQSRVTSRCLHPSVSPSAFVLACARTCMRLRTLGCTRVHAAVRRQATAERSAAAAADAAVAAGQDSQAHAHARAHTRAASVIAASVAAAASAAAAVVKNKEDIKHRRQLPAGRKLPGTECIRLARTHRPTDRRTDGRTDRRRCHTRNAENHKRK